MSDGLEQEICAMVIDCCNVLDVEVDDVDFAAPLLGPESVFGLDSLDAVEIVVEVQKRYGARIEAQGDSRQSLTSLQTLAEFVRQNRTH